MAALNSSSKDDKKKRSAPRIDMTPMVDLAFLLLTFFVMTTTLMKHRAIEIKQPVADETHQSTEVSAEKVLNLVLAKDDKVYWYMGLPGNKLNPTDLSDSGVRKLLLQKNSEIKGLYIFIKASDQSRYQNTIDILDEIMITGVKNYAMLSLDAEDKKLLQ